MPLLGFGTWQISNREARQATAHALDVGYRHIDTATMYRNEEGIGKALDSAGLDRKSVFVTTKLPPQHAGRERRTLQDSLSKLRLDYVDLWLVHWPPNGQAAPQVWEQLVKAQQDSLARAIGVSNYSLRQIDELIKATGVTPQVNQIRWGPPLYDPDMVAGLEQRGAVLRPGPPQVLFVQQVERELAALLLHRQRNVEQLLQDRPWKIRQHVLTPAQARRVCVVARTD